MILGQREREVGALVHNDAYMCALAALLLPSALCGVYVNWLGLKFFRHN